MQTHVGPALQKEIGINMIGSLVVEIGSVKSVRESEIRLMTQCNSEGLER